MARHTACAPDIARGGIGDSVPKDAVYPVVFVDAEGRPLNGANLDILHSEKGQSPPPANAFWLVTMCDEDGS
jgi:hypothetical protein